MTCDHCKHATHHGQQCSFVAGHRKCLCGALQQCDYCKLRWWHPGPEVHAMDCVGKRMQDLLNEYLGGKL